MSKGIETWARSEHGGLLDGMGLEMETTNSSASQPPSISRKGQNLPDGSDRLISILVDRDELVFVNSSPSPFDISTSVPNINVCNPQLKDTGHGPTSTHNGRPTA